PRDSRRETTERADDRDQAESRAVHLSPGRCRSPDRTGGERGEVVHARRDLDRRRFLGTTAAALAATQLGMLGSAKGLVPHMEGELSSLGRATEWLNSPPLTAAGLRGKVVLIDFCTYTCINWLRTLPYVRAWAAKYRDQGLVVIGVHTPEFPFDHDLENVLRAVTDMHVSYRIAIDNDYAIWSPLHSQ